ALYRRGVARSAFGFYAEAKADLLQVARLDPKNADARKELEKVKERIAKHNAEKKKAFSGLFDRAAGMYADREEQMRQKRLQEEEEEKRRQEMWEKEMEERREKGEEEISFADWKEERRKVEEEKKDKQRREQTSSPSSSPSTTASSGRTSKKTGGVESLELDEEDEKIINETKKMGYCYFRRDLTEEEKKLNAQHRPTRIEPAANAATSGASAGSSPVASNAENSAGGAAKQSGVSSWNSAGTTYEEKDVSEWAKKRFEARLKEAKVLRGNDIDSLLQNPEHLVNTLQGSAKGGDSADPLASLQKLMGQFMQTEIKCKEVAGLTGDAQVVVMRGTKRFLFEFACTVVFEVSGELSLPDSGLVPTAGDKDGTKFSYKGEITLPEVSSADGKGEAWLTGSRIKMKQKVDPRNQPIVDECIEAFKKQLVHQIHQFLSDFSKIA
ncbi:tetratricopeptide repeat-containing protein, partial [Toxoplasma gondii CAST]